MPVVLSVKVCPSGPAVFRAARTNARLRGRRRAEQEIRKGVAVPEPRGGRRIPWREGERSARVRGFARVELQPEDIRAELHAVRAANPGEVFDEVVAVVSAGEEIRGVACGRIRAGEIDRRVSRLVRIRSDAANARLRGEVYSLVLALLAACDAQECYAGLINQSGRKNMRLAER